MFAGMAQAFFVDLIQQLRGTGGTARTALADNLQRDLPYKDQPLPAKRDPGFGMNIPVALAEKVAGHLSTCTTLDCKSSGYPNDFQSEIFKLHPHSQLHAFDLSENSQNQVSADVLCVRYVSLRAFLSQALGKDNSDRSLGKPKENQTLTPGDFKKDTEILLRKHRFPGAPPSSATVWLHIKDKPKIVFVGPEVEAPDRQGSDAGLSGDPLACYVIRRMALPGFENAKRRADRGGFMALRFVPAELTPPLPLYKPTTFDAADNEFFRPGPTTEKHGLTDTLTATLDAVTGKSGCKEWVTRNGFVPLRPSAKHGPTWRFVAYFDPPAAPAVKPTPT